MARTALNLVERSCGPCSVCCELKGVQELHKPAFARCRHQVDGCAIYAERPESCRAYACLWQRGELGDERRRPDQLGLLFDRTVDGVLTAWEVRAGATEEDPCRYLLDKLSRKELVIVRQYHDHRLYAIGPRQHVLRFYRDGLDNGLLLP